MPPGQCVLQAVRGRGVLRVHHAGVGVAAVLQLRGHPGQPGGVGGLLLGAAARQNGRQKARIPGRGGLRRDGRGDQRRKAAGGTVADGLGQSRAQRHCGLVPGGEHARGHGQAGGAPHRQPAV